MKNKLMIIISMIMTLSLIIAGCTTKKDQPKNEVVDVSDSGDELKEVSKTDDDKIIVGLDVPDKKSEEERSQELLMQVIEDGNYVDEVSYGAHDGVEIVTIDITVEGDVIMDASVTPSDDAHKVSKKYINGVNDALLDLVIGKKIDEIELPKQISGSSITTAALGEQLQNLVDIY